MGLIALASGCGTQTETPITQSAAAEASADKVNRLLTFCERMHKSGDLAVAAGLCRRAYHLAPDDPRALIALGAIMLELGKPQDAVVAYRNALVLDERSIEALIGLGKAHLALKQFDQAERQFQLAVRRQETDYRGYNGLGVLHDLRGEHDTAQSFYQTGLRLAPGNASLRSNLGLSYSLTGRHRQAIAILGDLTNDYQSDATNRQNLALAYGMAGDMPTAERVARMDLGDAAVAKNLQYYSALQAKRRPEPAPPAAARPKQTGSVPAAKTPSRPVAARPAPTRKAKIAAARPTPSRKAKPAVAAKLPIKRHVPDDSVIASGTAPGGGLSSRMVLAASRKAPPVVAKPAVPPVALSPSHPNAAKSAVAAKRPIDRGEADDTDIATGVTPEGRLSPDAVLAASMVKSLGLPPVDAHPDAMTPDQPAVAADLTVPPVVVSASFPRTTKAVMAAERPVDGRVADDSAIASGTAPGGNPSSDAVLVASIAKSLGLPPVVAPAMTLDQTTAGGAVQTTPADLDVPALSQASRTKDQTTAAGAVQMPPADLDVPALSQAGGAKDQRTPRQVAGRYRLHLGSFRRRATADAELSRQRALIADLIEDGMALVVSEADLGSKKGLWYRVTMQGVDDRTGANTLCSALRARGLTCFVTVSATVTQPAPVRHSEQVDTAPPAQSSEPSYAVQLGAYRQESNLLTEWQRFKQSVPTLLGDQGMMVRHSWIGGRPLYMLNTVSQPDKKAAHQLCQELQSAGLDCVVAKVI